jgi:outer membrane protein TolC
MSLSLSESIALALERNYDIRIEGYNPQIRAADVRNEQAEFDPAVVAGYNATGGRLRVDDDPRQFRDRVNHTEVYAPSAGVEQRLQTGTRLALQFSQERIHSNQRGSTSRLVEPSNEFRTTLNITQPLLRNLGLDVNRTRIRVARTNQEISENVLKDRVIGVVSRVQQLYWDLVFRLQELEVRRLSLKLAQDLLEQTRIQVTVGTLPQLSILEAEAGVAAREEAVILGDNEVHTVEDRIKETLNLFERDREGERSIIPTTTPLFIVEETNLATALQVAYEHRPDYRQARLEIESRTLNERFTRNQLFPTLDLQGRIGLNGLDRQADDALNDFTSGDTVFYQIGLAFRYPLGNQAAKSRFLRARLEVEQGKALLQRLEERILVEVREAVRNVETNIKRVSVTRGAQELARKKLEAEQKKLAVGLSTVREILRFQDDLSRAQSSESRALTDYNTSQANLDRAKGTTLERLDISIGDR